MTPERWAQISQMAKEIAKQSEEQISRELDELCDPLTGTELPHFWIDFTSYFEDKYYT